MGTHIARWVTATLNLLLSMLGTTLFFFVAQTGSGGEGASPTAQFYWVIYALLTVVSMVATVLLLRRRTVQTGLKLHFGLANFGLLLLFTVLMISALGRPDHQLHRWELQGAYWIAALSGLWFGTGLTLKTLLESEAAKQNPAMHLWDATPVTTTVASSTVSAVQLPPLRTGSTNEEKTLLVQKNSR